MKPDPGCPLCHQTAGVPFHQEERRKFWLCPRCDLVFVGSEHLPTPKQERALYDKHQNSPTDAGYRRFLDRLALPLQQRLTNKQNSGLDFGSGPGPTLSVMLSERGYTMRIFDPLYASDRSVLNARYDFVCCTEAMEHFHHPAQEWESLCSLLRPGAWLGIMTRRRPESEYFANWHYKNDPTHVSFYSADTFRYIAQQKHLSLELIGSDVALLQKPAT